MPPKKDSEGGQPYNLSNMETSVAIHACKLLSETGTVDPTELMKLTGHNQANSALKQWSNVKKKMAASSNNNNTAAPAPAPAVVAPAASSGEAATPKKRGRKPKNTKARPMAIDSDDEIEESPAKRVKKVDGKEDADEGI